MRCWRWIIRCTRRRWAQRVVVPKKDIVHIYIYICKYNICWFRIYIYKEYKAVYDILILSGIYIYRLCRHVCLWWHCCTEVQLAAEELKSKEPAQAETVKSWTQWKHFRNWQVFAGLPQFFVCCLHTSNLKGWNNSTNLGGIVSGWYDGMIPCFVMSGLKTGGLHRQWTAP